MPIVGPPEDAPIAQEDLAALNAANNFKADDVKLADSKALISGDSIFDSFIPYAAKDSDTADFDARYISLDSLRADEDGSDLSYIRILSFKDGKFGNQIFPRSSGASSTYKEFIVTQLTPVNSSEKLQIIKTNKTLQIYSYDSNFEVFNIQGILKSTLTDNWDIAMVLLWDNLLRATKLIEMNAIMEFGYESNIYWGYPMNFQTQKSSSSQYVVGYSMQFIVVKRSILKSVFDDKLNAFYNDVISAQNR